jgi:hypothetical protein
MDFQAIAAGMETDRFIGHAKTICDRLAVDLTFCKDIYEVTAHLAKGSTRRGVVLGRLEKLSGEKGRLFEKASQAGWVCCCLAKKISGGARTQAIRAMQTGAIVINDAGQLEEVMMRLIRT